MASSSKRGKNPESCNNIRHARALKKETGIKFVHLNTGGFSSLPDKQKAVLELVSSVKDCVACALTETRLGSEVGTSIAKGELEIKGFKFYKIDGIVGRRGGQLIYVNNKYECRKLPGKDVPDNIRSLVECTILKISGKFEAIFCVFYVDGEVFQKLSEPFFEYLEEVCQYLAKKDARAIIMGDMNIDLMKNNARSRKLEEIMRDKGFQQLIQCPTREQAKNYDSGTKESRTLIDHVYLRDGLADPEFLKCERMDVDELSSDHHLTFLSF